MITENMIFDRLSKQLTAIHKGLYVTSVYEPVPKRLPCVFAYESHVTQRKRNISLTDFANHRVSTFTVEVYVKKDGGKALLQEITENVKQIFAGLFFILQTEDSPPNADLSITRRILRFSRAIGNGDTITKE